MSGNARYCDWIAVDWGTSNLRAWAMEHDTPKAEATSDAGMGRLDPQGFEPALLDLVEPWLGDGPTPVVACGMVGARQGWTEAPYRAVPAAPPLDATVAAAAKDRRLEVRLIPGMKQESPADVMRGEETQIAGFLSQNSGFDGVLCLPGTHTKWAQVSAGEVVSFRTFMSGELFALLSEKSVLRHSMAAGWDADAFAGAVSEAMSKPEALAARLFGIRAEGLLHGLDGAAARARLSGLLIGAEIAAARPYWLGQRVAIVGGRTQTEVYAAALRSLGVVPETAEASAMTLAGLSAARALIGDRR